MFTAVEAFVDDNCKEVSKDKFLCPLSGKKFRGPEFVRKHIFNKHGDAVQVVRDDVSTSFDVYTAMGVRVCGPREGGGSSNLI